MKVIQYVGPSIVYDVDCLVRIQQSTSRLASRVCTLRSYILQTSTPSLCSQLTAALHMLQPEMNYKSTEYEDFSG